MKDTIKALMENKEFTAKLEQVENLEAAKALFKEYGAELTDDIVAEIKAAESGELNVDALENVSGGLYDAQGRSRTWGQFFSYCITSAIFGSRAANNLNNSWGR